MPVAGLMTTGDGNVTSVGQSEYCFARAAGKERHCNSTHDANTSRF